MRRVYIALVLISLMVLVSIYSFVKVDEAHRYMTAQVDSIMQSVRDENLTLLDHQIDELTAYWNGTEDIIVHFVRHVQLDDIAKGIARLPILAEHNHDMLLAELSSIRWQIEHIWKSEIPSANSLF